MASTILTPIKNHIIEQLCYLMENSDFDLHDGVMQLNNAVITRMDIAAKIRSEEDFIPMLDRNFAKVVRFFLDGIHPRYNINNSLEDLKKKKFVLENNRNYLEVIKFLERGY